MKGEVHAFGEIAGRTAAARLVEGRLFDLLIDPPADGAPRPGTIFRAKADRAAKGQGGQFVAMGALNGFLRNGQIPAGEFALVQVTGFAEPGKAVPVTSKILFKGRYVIVTPGAKGVNISRQIRDDDRQDALRGLANDTCPEAKGLILRSSAAEAQDDAIADELRALYQLSLDVLSDSGTAPERLLDGPTPEEQAWIDWPNAPTASFAEFEVEHLAEEFQGPKVELGRASAWIEPTRALVAIDVNTGGDTSPAAGLKANIALAKDLPRQLRCRGLGGQITVDFAPFPKKDRRQVESALRAAFKSDPVETALVGWTPLGHFELQRKRERYPL